MPYGEVMFSSNSCEWATPDDFFAKVTEEFGAFDLDVCATPANAKAATFFTKEQDGLAQQWSGKCWMNPPYGRAIKEWMRKACAEIDRGRATLIACLVLARTDTAWWHDYAMRGDIRFIRGRLKFMCDGQKPDSAPFASALVIFRKDQLLRDPPDACRGLPLFDESTN